MKARGYRLRPVFSVPGGDVIETYTDLHREGDLLRTVRDDDAVMAAQGAAEATAEPAASLVTGGPGLGAAVHGLASAAADRVPVVLMTGDVREEGFQALKPEITSDGVKPSITRDPEEAASELVRCRPVILEGADVDDLDDVVDAVEEEPRDLPEEPLEEAFETVDGSRAVFLVGGGCRWAGVSEVLEEISRDLGVPIVETLRGRGVIPEHSPFNMGMVGVRGWADEVLRRADVVVALGARLTERTVDGEVRDLSIVHVGYEPPCLDPDVRVEGDLAAFLEVFADEADPDPWEPDRPAGPPGLDTVTFEIVEAAREAWIGPMTVDSGQVTATAILACEVSAPWELITPCRYCPVGFALPAAVGAASRLPEPTLAVMGDHAFLYSLPEWVTVSEEGLPVVGLVLRNGEMGFVRQFQEAKTGEVRGLEVRSDVQGFLEDLGVETVELEADRDEVYRTLRDIEMKKEPAVVFVEVPREDLPLP